MITFYKSLLLLFLTLALCGACDDDGGDANNQNSENNTTSTNNPNNSGNNLNNGTNNSTNNPTNNQNNQNNLPGPAGFLDRDNHEFEVLCEDRAHEGCYYVSNTGSYPDGTTAAQQLTLEEVNSGTFLPGDIILFRRQEVWRDQVLVIPSSGSESEDLIFSAYGEGARPAFLGSVKLSGFTNTSGNLWRSETTLDTNPREIDAGAQVFFEFSEGHAIFGHYEESEAGLDRVGDWTYAGGQVTVYAEGDPESLFASVEAPQTQRLIRLNNQEHLHFDSLVLKYMVNAGYSDSYANGLELEGLTITNNTIAYIGIKNSSSAYGVSLDRSFITIEGNEVHDCGRRGLSLALYETAASRITDVDIVGNRFWGGYHTTGLDLQGNAATSGGHVIENIHVHSNVFAGDPNYDIQGEDGYGANHIFMTERGTSSLTDVFIYNNIFTYTPSSSIKTEGGSGYYIINNAFYCFNHTYDNYHAHIFTGSTAEDIHIINNIFFNDAPDNRGASVEMAAGRFAQYTIDHNLYYNSAFNHARLLWVDGGESWFHDDDFALYQTTTGFDANSPTPQDPLFADAPTDFSLDESSPARGQGTEPPSPATFTTDFFGATLNSPPDLGPIQF